MPEQTDSHYLSIFTPSQTDPEDLEAIFVQREALLTDAIERIIESATTKNKQHQLIVGSRGSGKTHLISLLVHRLKKNKKLDKKLKIAWLNEDETSTSLLDILRSMFTALNKLYPKEFSLDEIQTIYDKKPDDAQQFLAELLAEKLKKAGQTCLVIMENMDALFDSIGEKGQKQLRAYLQENPLFTLFSTAQKLTDSLKNRKDPFFGFFQTEHLKPLTEEEAAELIAKIAELQNKKEVSDFIKTHKGKMRIRALHHLSGGNHRVYLVLSQFINRDSIDALVKPFLKMVDELTPYYQERLRWLPPVQRKIIETLSSTRTTMSVKEIAKRLFSSNQSISGQLKELKEKGYVKSNRRGRESLYEITEPLMRICVEVKDNQSNKPIAILVEFIRAWYDGHDLQDRLDKQGISPLSHNYLFAAYEKTINQSCAYLSEKGLMADLDTETLLGDVRKAKNVLALEELTKIIESTDVPEIEKLSALSARSAIFYGEEKYKQALKDLGQIIEDKNTSDEMLTQALYNRGIAYSQLGKLDEALIDYTQVIGMQDVPVEKLAQVFVNRGVAYYQLGKLDKVLADYTQVIGMQDVPVEKLAQVLYNRGVAYNKLGELDKALADYTQVIDMQDVPVWQLAMALINRGIVYAQLGKLEKSLSDFSQIIAKANVSLEFREKAFINTAVTQLLNNNWQESKTNLQEALFLKMGASIKYFRGVIDALFKRVIETQQRKKIAKELIELCLDNDKAIEVLSANITEYLGILYKQDPAVLKDNLISWQDAWLNAMQAHPELEVVQRIFSVGMNFLLSDNNEAVLLELVETEREILKQTFGLA